MCFDVYLSFIWRNMYLVITSLHWCFVVFSPKSKNSNSALNIKRNDKTCRWTSNEHSMNIQWTFQQSMVPIDLLVSEWGLICKDGFTQSNSLQSLPVHLYWIRITDYDDESKVIKILYMT